jgi:competence protein ComEC
MKYKLLKIFKENKFKIIIFFIFIIIFRYFFIYYNFNIKYKNEKENNKMHLSVIKNESISDDKISYLVNYDSNNFILNIYKEYKNEKTSLNSDFSKFVYGDILEIRSKIQIPEKLNNPYEFDYKRYLNSNNIVGTIAVYNVEKIGNNSSNILFKFAYFLRDDIGKKIDKYLPEKESGLFKSIIYGDDRSLDEKIKNDFSKNGILHLIAVSGSHMALLLAIMSIFDKIFSKKINLFLNIFVIIIFCIMSGLALATVRAAIIAIIFLICKNFNIKIDTYIKILISFFLIVIYNPYTIFNIGFTMSYLATIGIVMFYSQVYSLINIMIIKLLKIKYLKPRGIKLYIFNLLSSINKLFSISIAAQIMIIPVQLIYFNTFEITSFISNIFVVEITTIETFVGFLTIICIYIPFVSDILINSNYILLKIIINLTSFLSNLNLPTINFPRLNFLVIIVYYLCVLTNNFSKYISFKIFKIRFKYFKCFL